MGHIRGEEQTTQVVVQVGGLVAQQDGTGFKTGKMRPFYVKYAKEERNSLSNQN